LIREAGIVGLGGAGFPTFIKLHPSEEKAVECLVLNGAECEPYITADDAVMRTQPDWVLSGLLAMRHALQAKECVIAIEDNKPEAYERMRAVVAEIDDPTLRVVQVPTRYPTGGEKQLIKVLTGRVVPSGGIPLQIGVICHSISTAVAIHRAVRLGQPLFERIVTVTGEGITEPKNVRALLGTPIRELIEFCGGYSDAHERLIIGGPMMGFALPDERAPVIKAVNCLLAASRAELPPERPQMPCIRCGECANHCPMQLLPQQLYWHARAREIDKTSEYRLADCIECGICNYVCPSHIPLVHYFRYAKNRLQQQRAEKQRSEASRERVATRNERVASVKAAKAERMRAMKAAAANKQKSAVAATTDKPVAAQVERRRPVTPEGRRRATEIERRVLTKDGTPPSQTTADGE